MLLSSGGTRLELKLFFRTYSMAEKSQQLEKKIVVNLRLIKYCIFYVSKLLSMVENLTLMTLDYIYQYHKLF